jgi:hypothetical protein
LVRYLKADDVLAGFELLLTEFSFVLSSLFDADRWPGVSLLLRLSSDFIQGRLHLRQVCSVDQIHRLKTV